MSKSSRSKVTALFVSFIAATLLTGAWPANPQRPVFNDQETVLTRARDFLQTIYPEVSGKHFFLGVSVTQGIDQSWRQIYAIRLDVMPYDPLSERMLNSPVDPKTGKRLPPPENSLLRGRVWFNRGGWLYQFDAVGDVVHDKQNQAVRDLVQSRPEWSDADVSNACKKAGARYSPADRDQFVQALHLEKFERFLGHVKIKSVEFDRDQLDWAVRVEAPTADDKDSNYTLHFEPFDGKLTAISRGVAGAINENH